MPTNKNTHHKQTKHTKQTTAQEKKTVTEI